MARELREVRKGLARLRFLDLTVETVAASGRTISMIRPRLEGLGRSLNKEDEADRGGEIAHAWGPSRERLSALVRKNAKRTNWDFPKKDLCDCGGFLGWIMQGVAISRTADRKAVAGRR